MVRLDGFSLVRETVLGPASYATATPPTVDMDDLTQVEGVLSIFIDDGRIAQVVSLVGQTVTFRIRGDANPVPGTTGAIFVEAPDGTDLSSDNITVLAYGR